MPDEELDEEDIQDMENEEEGGEAEQQRPDYDIVLTLVGTDDKVEEVMVNVFSWAMYDERNTLAQRFCNMVNGDELLDEDIIRSGRWGFAQIVNDGEYITVRPPVRFESIKKMKDRAVQKLLSDIRRQDMTVALIGADEAVKAKIFKNLSRNAAADLKEDIERVQGRGVTNDEIKKIRAEIVFCMKHYENLGEIIFEGDE